MAKPRNKSSYRKPRNGGRPNSKGGSNANLGGKFSSQSGTTLSQNVPENSLNSVANFNWNIPAGIPVYEKQWAGFTPWKAESFPVLEVFDITPTLGISSSTQSPSHLLALTMYNYIIRINSANVPYDPVDIEMIMGGVQSVYAFIAWAKRIYRAVNTYSLFNRSLPNVLFDGMHVSLSSLVSNLSDFRAWLNTYILRASMLAIPAGVPFFDTVNQLYSSVFVDSPSDKAQMYMFNPALFYKYNEYDLNGGCLDPIPIWDKEATAPTRGQSQHNAGNATTGKWTPRAALTVTEIEEIGNNILQPLLNSQDFYRISSDILKAYGEGNLIKLEQVAAEETLDLNFDLNILSQIENMRIVPMAKQYNSSTASAQGTPIGNWYQPITQNPNLDGYLIYQYYPHIDPSAMGTSAIQAYQAIATGDQILNTHLTSGYPTSADVMDYVKLFPVMRVTGTKTIDSMWSQAYIESCSTEMVTMARIYTMYRDPNLPDSAVVGSTYYEVHDTYNYKASAANDVNNQFKIAALLDKFDYHHKYYVATLDSGSNYTAYNMFFDVDTFAVVPLQDIAQILDLMVIAQFKCPGYSYAITK